MKVLVLILALIFILEVKCCQPQNWGRPLNDALDSLKPKPRPNPNGNSNNGNNNNGNNNNGNNGNGNSNGNTNGNTNGGGNSNNGGGNSNNGGGNSNNGGSGTNGMGGPSNQGQRPPAGREPPPQHSPDGSRPPEFENSEMRPNQNQAPKQLTLVLGNMDNGTTLGSFNIFMFDQKMPVGADDFSGQAVGTTPPRTDSGSLDTHTGGFKGLGMNTVFPQFKSCNDITPTQIYTEMQANSIVPLQGKWDTSGQDSDWHIPSKSEAGSGVMSVVQPGNIYYIRTATSQVSAATGYRDIGMISKTDMEWLEKAKTYLCTSTTASTRRKRSGDSYGFTSVTLK